MISILQIVSTLLVLWVSWFVYRRYFSLAGLNNIPGPPSSSWVRGNLDQFYHRHGWTLHTELAEKYGAVVSLTSWFGKKMLFVFDPKALNAIVVRDQDIYEEAATFMVGSRLILGDGLLATVGDPHRKQRKILNPIFSGKHMRYMTPIFYSVTDRLRDALLSRLSDGDKTELDMLHWMSRTALELGGQGGLGVSFDPLVEDIRHPYVEAIKAMPSTTFSMPLLRSALPYIYNNIPQWVLRPIMKVIPHGKLQRARQISLTLDRIAREILESKRTALKEGDEAVMKQVAAGKDILSILIQENTKADGEDRMPDHELIGHMSTFIFAATDTTSGALSRTLYLLAKHSVEQEKLRQEIKNARGDGRRLSYDELASLPYLDAVCRESLRVFAPTPYVTRTTRQDVILPLSTPICGKDGKPIEEIHIPNNTSLFVGILAANKCKEIWGEDAYEWKPDRWMSPLPDTVLDSHFPGVYSNLMTFLGGGRGCIGVKFAQLELRTVLSMLIEHFTFELIPNKDIYWNFAGITYPTVGPIDPNLGMPLLVGLAK